MRLNKLFAAGLSIALLAGATSGAWAQCPVNQRPVATTTTVVDPAYRGTVNVDIVDPRAEYFTDRVRCDVMNKPAPQVGQTRGAVESVYGPAQEALAPGKAYDIYTNEADLAGGRYFIRNISQENLRVYEVTYNNTGTVTSATDKVVDVKLRVIPRVGDHINLITKLMGDEQASIYRADPTGEHMVISIPRQRYQYFNSVISSPFKAINAFFDHDGFLVGQEIIPYRTPQSYVFSSAGRYIEHEAKWQPDRKIGW